MHYITWKQLISYIRLFRQDPARTTFISWHICSYHSSLPREKPPVSDPEIFYHGWQIKHFFSSVLLEVSHTAAQPMVHQLLSPPLQMPPKG